MSYIAENLDSYLGKPVGDGECVAFVKVCCSTPSTSKWIEGVKVKGAAIEKGMGIATFQDGKYQNRTNGDSHAAVYINQDKDGLHVYDQWKGQPVHPRIIHFRNGDGAPRNDGSAYSVIE